MDSYFEKTSLKFDDLMYHVMCSRVNFSQRENVRKNVRK